MTLEIMQVYLPNERGEVTPARQQALCEILAKIGNIALDEIQIVAQKQEDGLWLALEVPKGASTQYTRLAHEALAPLWSVFHNAEIALLPIDLPLHTVTQLSPAEITLLRLLFIGTKRVIVKDELSGGYSGASVLVVEPIDQQDRARATQIAKLASAQEVKKEQERYTKYIENFLTRITPRLKSTHFWHGKAGICYDFVEGGVLGHTKTLEKFYQDQPTAEPIVQTIRTLIEKELGNNYYRQTQPHNIPFAAEYGADLVEHLLITLRFSSTDGVWREDEAPRQAAPYQRLLSTEIATRYSEVSAGSFVQISGLTLQEVKHEEKTITLRLSVAEVAGVVIKVRLLGEAEQVASFAIGDALFVRGEVVHNRRTRLEALVFEAFAQAREFALEREDLKVKTLTWCNGELSYPNPLRHYPALLGKVLHGRKSLVHGDLHLRNVLVDESGRGYLIDFALVGERHNIFDLIKLETYIRQMILGQAGQRFSLTEYLRFEEELARNTLSNDKAALPDDAQLRKASIVIQEIRRLAAQYITQPTDWRGEYFTALCLYNLVVLKYEKHGGEAARFAFLTAAVLLKYVQQSSEERTPTPKTSTLETSTDATTTPLLPKPRLYDRYTHLEIGAEKLLSKLDQSQPEYSQAMNQQLFLSENIQQARMVGDSDALENKRRQILLDLNYIAISAIKTSFRDLCPRI